MTIKTTMLPLKLNTNKKTINIGIYIRVSTSKQDNNFSKENQLNIINKYIEETFSDFAVVSYIYNETSSASIPPKPTNSNDYVRFTNCRKIFHRPILTNLLIDAELGKFNHILVYTHDRLSRNEHELEIIYGLLKKANVKLHYCSPDEVHTQRFSIIDDFQSTLAALEALSLNRRATEGLATAVRNCFWSGGVTPFGYNKKTIYLNSKPHITLEKNYQQACIVYKIFNLYVNGFSTKEIAKEIESLPLYSNGKRKWTDKYILSLIKNPTYSGYLTWNKRGGKKNPIVKPKEEYVQSDFNPSICIVPKDIWDEAQAIVNSHNYDSKAFNTPFLFKNIIKCPYCNTTLGTKNRGNVTGRVYYCTNKSCNRFKAIKTTYIHSLVLSYLTNDLKETLQDSDKATYLYSEYTSYLSNSNNKLYSDKALLERDKENLASSLNKLNDKIDFLLGDNSLETKGKKAILLTALIDTKGDHIETLRKLNSTIIPNTKEQLDKNTFLKTLESFISILDTYIKDKNHQQNVEFTLRKFLVNNVDSIVVEENNSIILTLK